MSEGDDIRALLQQAEQCMEQGDLQTGRGLLERVKQLRIGSKDRKRPARILTPTLLPAPGWDGFDAVQAGVAQQLLWDKRYDAVTEIYGAAEDGPLASAVSASLLRLNRLREAQAYIASMPACAETMLKRKTVELLTQLRGVQPDPEPRVHVILLVYNREQDVTEALRQLARTDYVNYKVFIADNGSNDGSVRAVRDALHRFPKFIDIEVEELPTNIGRPAGHNWLLTKYDHSEAEYIAIADDDLTDVPPDWLREMVKLHRIFPKALVVGGKAVNPEPPKTPQGGGVRIVDFEPGKLLCSFKEGDTDFGQYDYIDRCDHVIGCLNVFNRANMMETGLFDIRFSPCQLVDIEHQLRGRLAGLDVIYSGLIEFGHKRAMGEKSLTDRSHMSNSFGNLIKLTMKHDHEAVKAFIEEQARAHEEWLRIGNE